MKNNRLEVILQRNQQNVVLDVILAVLFLVAAMTTGLAMKTAFGQLAGVRIATSSAEPTLTAGTPPCADRGMSSPSPSVLI